MSRAQAPQETIHRRDRGDGLIRLVACYIISVWTFQRRGVGNLAGHNEGESTLAKSKAKTGTGKKRAPKGFRTTSIKVTKTRAAEYRAAKNPDFKVRTIRHGRKPAEFFVDVTHQPNQKVELVKQDQRWGLYIARTTRLKNGEVREITLPYNNTKIEKFIAKAEKDPGKVNALKEEGDLFGFTVEGHKVQATFKSAGAMRQLIEFYQNTGSKGARIQIFRIKKRADWADKQKSVAAIKRNRTIREPRRMKAMPLKDMRVHDVNRKKRYIENRKADQKRYTSYLARERKRSADRRKRLRKGRHRK